MTGAPAKFLKIGLSSSQRAQKQVTLQESDKSGNCITIKITSQLNDASGNLNRGVFTKLQQFHVLKHSHGNNFPACSVVLCVSLKIVRFSIMLVDINKTPNNSKKDGSTNDDDMLQEEVVVKINKTPNDSRKYESTNSNTMLQEEVISDVKKCNLITQKGA